MKNLDIMLNVLSYEATSPTNDPSDSIKIQNKIQDVNLTDVFRLQMSVADGVTDQAIAITSSDSEYLVILTDRQVSIKLNGSFDSLTLSPRANGKKTFVFYQKGTISELTISNASGSAANIDILTANK